ncbi:MAG: hypothetical protein AAF672_08505 [Pseudomonadota bacterium]
MTDASLYTYADGDLLSERNVYSYSAYHGRPFLDAWRAQRATALETSGAGNPLSHEQTPAFHFICAVHNRLKSDPQDTGVWRDLDRLLQRFEVTKRVHHAYTDAWRAVDKTKFDAAPAYVSLAEAMAWAYSTTGRLTYLNTLLKLLDTLSNLINRLPGGLAGRVDTLMGRELRFVEVLISKLGRAEPKVPDMLPEVTTGGAKSARTVLLACSSARSRAYLEALCHFNLAPGEVIVMGPETDAARGPETQMRMWEGIFMPSLQMSLSEICAARGIALRHLPDRDVNAALTRAAVADLDCDLVVYSGVGGQIVSDEVLRLGPPFLHMHSGYLPDYRGSTTFYYAMLNNDLPSVSSILLDPGIDTGPILKRQAYPMPAPGMNVDLLYDTAIRADLLCRTLSSLDITRETKPELVQSPENGTTYYEIHPVLKHIALLSRTGELT